MNKGSLTHLRCYLLLSIPLNSVMFIKEIAIQLYSLMVLSKFSFLFFFVVLGCQNKKKVMNPDIHLNLVGFLF